jgi:hypothetical protein
MLINHDFSYYCSSCSYLLKGKNISKVGELIKKSSLFTILAFQTPKYYIPEIEKCRFPSRSY